MALKKQCARAPPTSWRELFTRATTLAEGVASKQLARRQAHLFLKHRQSVRESEQTKVCSTFLLVWSARLRPNCLSLAARVVAGQRLHEFDNVVHLRVGQLERAHSAVEIRVKPTRASPPPRSRSGRRR